MAISDTSAKIREQTLSTMRSTQENLVNLLKPFADLADSVMDVAPVIPFADKLPEPKVVVGQWFDFVADALATQKEFALLVVDMLPDATAKSTKTASRGPVTKAA